MVLNHLDLQVEDVQQAVAFFEAYFGFVPQTSRTSPAIAVLHGEQGFVLVLQRRRDASPYPDGFHIGFYRGSPEAVRAFHARLKDDDVEVTDVIRNARGTIDLLPSPGDHRGGELPGAVARLGLAPPTGAGSCPAADAELDGAISLMIHDDMRNVRLLIGLLLATAGCGGRASVPPGPPPSPSSRPNTPLTGAATSPVPRPSDPSIVITPEKISLDGEDVADTAAYAFGREGALVDALYARLNNRRTNGRIIDSDKRRGAQWVTVAPGTPGGVVYSAVLTAARAGYVEVHFKTSSGWVLGPFRSSHRSSMLPAHTQVAHASTIASFHLYRRRTSRARSTRSRS